MLRKTFMSNTQPNINKSSSMKSNLKRQVTFNKFKDNITKRKLFLQRETLKSQRNFSNIMSRMSNVCYNMVTKYNGDEIIMNNLRRIALNQTQRLGIQMKHLSRVNAALNYHFKEKKIEKLNNQNDTIEEFKRYKKDNDSSFVSSCDGYNENSNNITYSDISMVKHKNKAQNRTAMRLEKYFQKHQKLEMLKGEILLNDQRKKYHIHKTYEKPKVFEKGHFFRKELNRNEYKPYSCYKKENLYFNKSYKHIKLKIDDNNNSTTNNKELKHNRTQTELYDKSNITDNHPLSRNKQPEINKTFYHSNAFLTSSNNLSTSTTANAYTSTTQPQIRLIKTAFFEKGSQDMYNSTKNQGNISPKQKERLSKSKHKKQLEKLKDLYNKAFNRSRNISYNIHSNLTEHEEMKKKFVKFKKEKYDFDLEKIIEDLKVYQHKYSKSGPLSEEEIVRRNAMKVAKMIPKENLVYLSQMVNEILSEQKILHKGFTEESNLSKRLFQLRQKKEFQRVCDETMILKKHYRNTVEPKNELLKIKKIIQDIHGNMNNSDNLQKMWFKLKVMKDIKPLLNNNKIMRNKQIKKGGNQSDFIS